MGSHEPILPLPIDFESRRLIRPNSIPRLTRYVVIKIPLVHGVPRQILLRNPVLIPTFSPIGLRHEVIGHIRPEVSNHAWGHPSSLQYGDDR